MEELKQTQPEEAGFQSANKNNADNDINNIPNPINNNPKIKIEGIYKKVVKNLKTRKLIFTCKNSNCNVSLFTSYDVDSIYVQDNEKFNYLIDPTNCSGENFKITKAEVYYQDEELKQMDCLYNLVRCKYCDQVIGRYFLGTSLEKKQLRDKILIPHNKTESFYLEYNNIEKLNLKDYVKISAKESEEIKELCETLDAIAECYFDTLKNIDMSRDFLEIRKYVKKTEEYVDKLKRLSLYVNYLMEKNNNIDEEN